MAQIDGPAEKIENFVNFMRINKPANSSQMNAFLVALESIDKEEAWNTYKAYLSTKEKVDPILIVNLRSFMAGVPISQVLGDNADTNKK